MPIDKTNSKRRFYASSKFNLLVLAVGLSLLGFGGFRVSNWYRETQGSAPPPIVGQTVTFSTATPDEKPVPKTATYDVPADQPRRISIGSIATEGFIQRVGKDQHGNVGVPTNAHYAGWFANSALPGESGLSVIDGHVSSRYGSALFARLGSLRKDDVIEVEFGDYSVRKFKVVESRELPEASAAEFLLNKQAGIDQQLNIITCGGRFNKKLSSYNHRIVVVTKRSI